MYISELREKDHSLPLWFMIIARFSSALPKFSQQQKCKVDTGGWLCGKSGGGRGGGGSVV